MALIANALIAVAKFVAAAMTGSSAMLAESFHPLADTGNEGLLLVAQRRSARPPDESHRLGYGREAYFWALLAAVGVFVAGSAVARVRDLLAAEPGVVGVREVSISYIGPGQVTVDARIDVEDDLSGAEVEALARRLDGRLRAASPAIRQADVVPTG